MKRSLIAPCLGGHTAGIRRALLLGRYTEADTLISGVVIGSFAGMSAEIGTGFGSRGAYLGAGLLAGGKPCFCAPTVYATARSRAPPRMGCVASRPPPFRFRIHGVL